MRTLVENPFCILQPNNKRCSSSRPPVSLSLRSVRSVQLVASLEMVSQVKEKERWRSDTKKDAREKSYCRLLLFSYLFQLTSRPVRSPFTFSLLCLFPAFLALKLYFIKNAAATYCVTSFSSISFVSPTTFRDNNVLYLAPCY